MDIKKPVRPSIAELEAALKSEKRMQRPTLAQLEEALAEERRRQEKKQNKRKAFKERKQKTEKPEAQKPETPEKVEEPKPDKPKTPEKAEEPKPYIPDIPKEIKPAKSKNEKQAKPKKGKKTKVDKPEKAKSGKQAKKETAKPAKGTKPKAVKQPKRSRSKDKNTSEDTKRLFRLRSKNKKSKDKKAAKKKEETATLPAQRIPDPQALEEAIQKHRRRLSFWRLLRNTIIVLITVSAAAALIATLFLPVLKVHSGSMAPNLQEGDIVVSVKQKSVSVGDVIAFYYNNKLFIKRVIAGPSSIVNIDDDGNVYVNDVLLDEPYVAEKSAGVSDISYPYLVPEDCFFVLGDSRINSSDSRSSTMGCVSLDDLLGKVIFRVWPLNRMSLVR